METYLNDPMQGMQGMQGMQQMKLMQSMCPMMEMKIMYKMMQNMHQMMQNMYQMSQMQGMQGMQGMNGMSQFSPMNMQEDKVQFPIPMIVKLEQSSPNQIQISYDRDVEIRLGMKPTNYWIKDTMNVRPAGIATLGRNDNVNAENSLTSNMVKIEPKNGSAKTFILTFNRTIPKGAEYMLIICYVTVKGAPPYSGDNGMATFVGK